MSSLVNNLIKKVEYPLKKKIIVFTSFILFCAILNIIASSVTINNFTKNETTTTKVIIGINLAFGILLFIATIFSIRHTSQKIWY